MFKSDIKRLVTIIGVVLWIGALSPEIFVKSGEGCIFNENGEALSEAEAQEFMEKYFYLDENLEDEPIKIKFKLGFLDWL